MAWLDELKLNVDARVAVIHLATIDEEEAMRTLSGWSQSSEWPEGMGLITWDIGDQFRHLREPAATFSKLAATPETVLDIIDDYKGSATFVLKDFHHFWEHNRKVSRMLRNLASRLPFRSAPSLSMRFIFRFMPSPIANTGLLCRQRVIGHQISAQG